MGVASLQHGAGQPFYQVLCDDGSERYVAQENVEPLTNNVDPEIIDNLINAHPVSHDFNSFTERLCLIQSLMQSTGKWFRCVELTETTARFVPAIDLEHAFPDDV